MSGGGITEAERFLPEAHGARMAQEHLHRYAVAAALLGGRSVLDLGSGAGYGTALLRARGARVVAVDLDVGAARRAAPAICADALTLPFSDARFDAVVCFEMIEHVPEPALVLDEIARVLAPGGIALVSTPDRAVYTERAGNRNPYHLHELTRDEFAALLSARFRAVTLHGQSLWAGSWLSRLDPDRGAPADGVRRIRSIALASSPRAPRASWVDPESESFPTPMYLIALCAHDPDVLARFERRAGPEQLLHDPRQAILAEHDALAEGVAERDRELASAASHARNLDDRIAERSARVAALEVHAANLEKRLSEGERHSAALEVLLAEARERSASVERHAHNVEQQIAEQTGHAQGLREHVANLERLLAAHGSRVAELETHIANLEPVLAEREARVAELEVHATNVGKTAQEYRVRADGLEQHAANLEAVLSERRARIDALEQHAANSEAVLSERRARIDALEQHAANLEAVLSERRARIDGLEEHVRNIERVLAEREARIDGLDSHAANLESQVAAQQAALRENEGRIAAAESDALASQQTLLAEQAALREVREALAQLRSSLWLRAGRRLRLLE